VAARDCSDIAVFYRHGLACFLQLVLQIRPHVSDRYVESKNPAVHCLDQLLQPHLHCGALLAALGSHPKGQLRDND